MAQLPVIRPSAIFDFGDKDRLGETAPFLRSDTAGVFVAIPSSNFRNSRESSFDQPVPQPPT
jgi:hypothetical protein